VKSVNFSNKKSLNNRHSSGFALPTILIVSIIMLMVLVAAVSSAASVRMAMVSQYYNQLSQTAADAGTAYANSCLDSNNGTPQWSDASPIKPNTDCYGVQLAGFTCPVASVDPRCYISINSGVISSFSVNKPEVDINGKVVNLNVKGFVNLVRTSNGSVWRSYSQSNNTKTSYPGIVTNGLVMNLDAGDPLSYSGNGTGWTDLSGNNNNGVLMNGVGYSSANGGALSFDGVDDYVDCGNLGSFPSNGSISFWMNPSVVENYRDPFTTNYNAGYTTNVGIRFEEHVDGYFEVDYGNDAGAASGTAYLLSGLTANNWYHVSLVWDVTNSNIKGYLDGAKIFDKTQTLWPTKMPAIAIGAGFNTTRYWKGLISGAQIYNRALLASEIQQNFNSLRNRYYVAARGANISPGFSDWVLSGGATYNSTNGELTLGSAGLATSPLIRVYYPTSMRMGADYYATVASVNLAPDGGSHMSSYYYAADGVTAAYNSANYTANGCAQRFALSTWDLQDLKCGFAGGPNVTYVKFIFRGSSSSYASSDLKVKNPILVLTD